VDNLSKTMVLGGSLKPHRYSNRAIRALRRNDYQVVSFGRREGEVEDVKIHTDLKEHRDVHTITFYLSASNQKDLYSYIFSLNAKRFIFNPGSENYDLAQEASKRGIEVMEVCTLVMLRLNQY